MKIFIKVERTDSITSHLKHIFLYKDQEKICGSFNGNHIKVWTSSNSVIGAFYPIIYVSFDEAKNTVALKAKMNKIGLALALVINVLIIPAALDLFILGDSLSIDTVVIRIIVCIIFIGIFNFPIYMSYKVAREVLKKQVKEVLSK